VVRGWVGLGSWTVAFGRAPGTGSGPGWVLAALAVGTTGVDGEAVLRGIVGAGAPTGALVVASLIVGMGAAGLVPAVGADAAPLVLS